MTFDELQQKIDKQDPRDWHQHSNGGGWVHKNARVEATAYVGGGAIVWGGIVEGGIVEGGIVEGGIVEGGIVRGGIVEGGTIRGGIVEGGTILGGTVEGGTILGGTVEGGTIRSGTILGGTILGGTVEGGTIRGGVWDNAPLFIVGSQHPLTNSAPGELTIGCISGTFAWWKKNYQWVGKENYYTPAQIREYKAYIDLIAKYGKKAPRKGQVQDQ